MVSQNYDLVAKRLIEMAKSMPNFPESILSIIEWREQHYFGHIQQPYENYKDIVSLSKTSKPINPELKIAIRKVKPDVLELIVDNDLDLEGRHHLLRKIENKLTIMTPEQTRYVEEHPISLIELNP